MKQSHHLELEAPPEKVFFWLDDSDRVMQWAKGVVENEDLTTTEEGVGSTFRQVYEENGRKMEFQGTCTAYEKDKRLAIHMTGKMFDLDVDYRLDDLGGRTRLTQVSEVRWKGLMKLFSPIMSWMAKKQGDDCLTEDFGRLKSLVENGAER